MTVKPIRSPEDHASGLRRAAQLAAETDQASLDELEVLSALIERWEQGKVDLPPPDPIEAVRFRMRQASLKPRDLEPLIGSRARVSEVLSGTRALTLEMMRALHRHLDIPASSLLAKTERDGPSKIALPSSAALRKLRVLGAMQPGEEFAAFVSRAFHTLEPETLHRKSCTERTNAKTDKAALTAWCAAVMLRAENVVVSDPDGAQRTEPRIAARDVAKLSRLPDGPRHARDVLARHGIVLVVLEHLPGTYLDGAAMLRRDGKPIIAITLRHDRIDNFWFTLLHEYCHAALHLRKEKMLILDDLELKSIDEIEAEADAFASEVLIPASIWDRRSSRDMQSDAVFAIAAAAGIHPAIVAGRWQRENCDYRRFSKLLGRGEVRCHFL